MRLRPALVAFLSLFIVGLVLAADPVHISTAEGKITKVDKDSLSFEPREANGKFGKALTLKITGTSKFTTLAPQTRDKKLVMTQKETEAKDLAAGQIVAVIYAEPKGQEPVLLSAVAQPAADK